jgi:hypothetical protein
MLASLTGFSPSSSLCTARRARQIGPTLSQPSSGTRKSSRRRRKWMPMMRCLLALSLIVSRCLLAVLLRVPDLQPTGWRAGSQCRGRSLGWRRQEIEDLVAGGIRRGQNRAEQISMTRLGGRQKCLRIRSENRQFPVSYGSSGSRTGPLRHVEKPPRSNPASNVAFASPLVSVRV